MVDCPLCEQPTHVRFRVKDYNRAITDEVFTYYQCTACDLIFLHPIPQNLGDYYREDYYNVPQTVADLQPVLGWEAYKVDLIQQFVRRGSLMEIGPAFGAFAHLAKQAGFTVSVIEMDASCCEFIGQVLGITAINEADTIKALEELGSFDVIALWHVFEHLTNPWEVLREMARHINPGGILVIAVPNPDAFQFRVLGKRWTHVDAPRHLSLIPVDLLVEQARQYQLEPLLTTTVDRGGIGWNAFGWSMSLASYFQHLGLRFLAHYVGRVLWLLAKLIEQRDLNGAAYTLILRRKDQ